MPATCRRCRSARAEIYIPYARLSLCPGCFLDYYVRRIKRTVKEYHMFKENDRIGVAVSGGKDSSALLHGLHRSFPNLSFVGLHINLGIPDYSDHCQARVRELTELLGCELHVFDLQEEEGITISDFKKTVFRRKICSACGTVKRHVLEELAQRAGVKVLATGHNLDDVAGFMLNNFFSGQWSQLVRLKPVLQPPAPGLSLKVKPLFKTPENESLLYCLYAEVPFREAGCPLSSGTKTRERLDLLETLSVRNPSFRHQVLRSFLRLIPLLESTIEKPRLTPCERCGFPSISGVCAYCKRVSLAKKASGKD